MSQTVTHPLVVTTSRHDPRLSGRGLVKRYGSTTALAGVDIDLGEEEALAIMGPSGSGKSTLLHVLAGVLVPDEGAVTLRGRRVERLSERERSLLRRGRYGFVFQHGQLLSELTALENVAIASMLDGEPRAQAQELAVQWLAALGVADERDRRPGEMSGGQAQRVAVARALVTRPDVVFADEPTANLDSQVAALILDLFSERSREEGRALLIVTHDPKVRRVTDRVIRIEDGRIAA